MSSVANPKPMPLAETSVRDRYVPDRGSRPSSKASDTSTHRPRRPKPELADDQDHACSATPKQLVDALLSGGNVPCGCALGGTLSSLRNNGKPEHTDRR